MIQCHVSWNAQMLNGYRLTPHIANVINLVCVDGGAYSVSLLQFTTQHNYKAMMITADRVEEELRSLT